MYYTLQRSHFKFVENVTVAAEITVTHYQNVISTEAWKDQMENKTVTPFFSIIIPTLNEEVALPNLLDDLSRQTYKEFEVIIVDGNSEDKTVKKAEAYKNKLVSLQIIQADKRNVSHQKNTGTKIAQTDHLIFLDADNRIPDYFLQGIKFHIEMLKPDILTTWFESDTSNKKDKAAAYMANMYMDIQKSSKKPAILESFLYVKKGPFTKLNGFNEKIHWAEGSELLTRALKRRMRFSLVKNPRYVFSFRRLRKQGTLNMFRNFAELEFNRLIGRKISIKRKRSLYPLEGGNYFEIGTEEKNRIGKIFQKLISTTQSQIENGNHNFVKFFFNRLFSGREKSKNAQKRLSNQSLPK